MAKTDPINPNVPATTGERPSRGDDRIRALARANAEVLAIDHYMGSDSGSGYTEDAAGEHKRVKFNAPISTPSNVANKGFLYIKDVSSKAELHWEDEDGNELQLSRKGTHNAIPAGVVVPYAGSSAPAGWLLCVGSAVSRTTYADLFTAIGTGYGVGDGSTTFNIPDMRGRVPVGLDAANVNLAAADALGETGGAETVTLTSAQSGLPAHNHGVKLSTFAAGSSYPLGGTDSLGGQINTNNNTAANASESHTNLQPFNTVNYIIKT